MESLSKFRKFIDPGGGLVVSLGESNSPPLQFLNVQNHSGRKARTRIQVVLKKGANPDGDTQ